MREVFLFSGKIFLGTGDIFSLLATRGLSVDGIFEWKNFFQIQKLVSFKMRTSWSSWGIFPQGTTSYSLQGPVGLYFKKNSWGFCCFLFWRALTSSKSSNIISSFIWCDLLIDSAKAPFTFYIELKLGKNVEITIHCWDHLCPRRKIQVARLISLLVFNFKKYCLVV